MLLIEDSIPGHYLLKELNQWRCPECNKGILRLEGNIITKESFISKTTPPTVEDKHGVFTGLLICSQENCRESVIISGEYERKMKGGITKKEYYPSFFNPPLQIFDLQQFDDTAITPETLEIIRSAFGLFWMDTNSCVNKIRGAIEQILTDKGIARFKKVWNKKKQKNEQKRIPLHDRIGLFEKKYPKWKDIGQQLMAIKWIGNDGSHAEEDLDEDTVLVGFKLLYRTLEKLYGEREKELQSIVSTINKRKTSR